MQNFRGRHHFRTSASSDSGRHKGRHAAGRWKLAFSTRAVMLSSVTLCRFSSWEKAEATCGVPAGLPEGGM